MSDEKPNPFGPFNWKQIEDLFGGKLPFGQSGGDSFNWIENYVQEALKKATPYFDGKTAPFQKGYQSDVFETHRNVIVRIRLKDRAAARKVRPYIGATSVRLEGLPDKAEDLIKLPCPVVPTSCKAVHRDGVLQLHIRKQTLDQGWYEPDILME